MTVGRNIYRVIRSILFSAILTLIGLYVIAYSVISIPTVQNIIKEVAETELSKLAGGDISIESISIQPFSEIMLTDVALTSPTGDKCITVHKLGAGINLWRLVVSREIEITYAEVLGLTAHISQEQKDGPLNIKFLIDALSPKDKNKPPTRFDLRIRQVALRNCNVSFEKKWLPSLTGKFDPNHLQISNLRADISLPKLKNDDFDIEIKRLSFVERSGLKVNRLLADVSVTNRQLSLSNLEIALPQSFIKLNDQQLNYSGYNDIIPALKEESRSIILDHVRITPSDLQCFAPELKNFNFPLFVTLDVAGNLGEINIKKLDITTLDERLFVGLRGSVRDMSDFSKLQISMPSLSLYVSEKEVNNICSILPFKDKLPQRLLSSIGELKLKSNSSLRAGRIHSDTQIFTALGKINANISSQIKDKKVKNVKGTLDLEKVNLGLILSSLTKIEDFGIVTAKADVDVDIVDKDISGNIKLEVPEFGYRNHNFSNLALLANLASDRVEAELNINDSWADLSLTGSLSGLKTKSYSLEANADIRNLTPCITGLTSDLLSTYTYSGEISTNIAGSNLDNVVGNLSLSNLKLLSPSGKELKLNHLNLIANGDSSDRNISVSSDLIDGTITGSFTISAIIHQVKSTLAAILPSFFQRPSAIEKFPLLNANLNIKSDNKLVDYFGLTVRLLTDIPITLNMADGKTSLDIDIPYLQQGKDKLIQATSLKANLDAITSLGSLDINTTYPVKNDEVKLSLSSSIANDSIETNICWDFQRPKDYKGKIALALSKEFGGNTTLQVLPGEFQVADTTWHVGNGRITGSKNKLSVSGLKVWHANQQVSIEGSVSSTTADTLNVKLADIDLDYIFDTLNINYVTFGGRATGQAWVTDLFNPEGFRAATEGLKVRNLTYNGALLGDGDLKGTWHPENNSVGIFADIAERGRRRAIVDGAVWVKRDSLAFTIDADSVNVKFMQPFMAAFSSDFNGRASGRANLYGTFSDIDLTGLIHADSINMLVDYTNVRYHGADSVVLTPGLIKIPKFKIYDPEGGVAILDGRLSHRYFHDPVFDFRISESKSLLCYNTNSSINPRWYGHITGNGGGSVVGAPGKVEIFADMTIAPSSKFTFVLSDTEDAADYTFLSFTDKRRAEEELRIQQQFVDTVPDFVHRFRKQKQQQAQGPPSIFAMDIRATVNPDAEMVLVMDPVAGDKIKAYGSGALQLGYDSSSDELSMHGRYTIDRGAYNFSLQDIILKDFTLRRGSQISFNGDPLRAHLDIDGIYRVNTSLTDLDKSFSTDRDLNRTNVPVEAVLKVRGEMTSPEISFDIELPTLTQDVARKVKSIISTDEMMNRQIIYLLALNRFSTPEYMGSGSNGGEWASVASATLGSQLTNALSSLTDKITLAPSLRSEKGDFSDVEVDLALSSSLLNNRLLLNGNFGYRDRSSSSTTFVGDFDLEYLLNRRGTWRLKAYNHFNDQNYWLRQALTTQGIGVMYRRDFDHMFRWLRPKKKK